MNQLLQWELASADPMSGGEDPKLRDLVRRMATDAREAAESEPAVREAWWRRRVVPLALAGVLALTGAAVAIPLSLSVDGTRVELDAEIPIIYTTDTGVEVSCRYGIYFGDPANRSDADERLAEFVNAHDWSGIGQRIYDEAIANPFAPGPDDNWESDNQDLRDQTSFSGATGLIWDEIPDELQQAGQSAGGTMDCKGQLH